MMKLMNKKLTKKGFTLAELLIVVAILAILVAVSIPIFTSKLDKAKEATDLANERAAKAAAVVEYMDNTPSTAEEYFYDAKNGTVKDARGSIEAYGQKQTGIVKVTITPGATDGDNPTIAIAWVA